MSILRVFKQKPLLWLYVGGGLLLVAASALWCFKVSTDPERVFWATIGQGFATRSVTIQAEQSNQGTSVRQVTQYSLGAANLSHTFTTLSQSGATVRNEMLSTPAVDYTRYTSISTSQKRADGKPLDFSKILGVWAKGTEGQGQLFQQTVLGTSLPLGGMGVPIGYVSPEERTKLMEQTKNSAVYQVDFSKVKRQRTDGRLVYGYDVALQPVAYVALIKQFAQDVGLHQLDGLDPSTYKGQKSLKLTVFVDVRARHIVEVSVPGAEFKQNYGSYDVPIQLALPKSTITTTQLQERLSKLQQ